MPDASFWEHLFNGVTPGGKIILLVLLVIAFLGAKALSVIGANLKETRHEAKEARKEAALAAERSLPTSNGFVQGVKDTLEAQTKALRRIEEGLDQTKTDVSAIKAEQQRVIGNQRRFAARLDEIEQREGQ